MIQQSTPTEQASAKDLSTQEAFVALLIASELTLHARSEEEVLYPAAILVGDVIRARLSAK